MLRRLFNNLLQIIPKIKSDINFPNVIIIHRKRNNLALVAIFILKKQIYPF